MVTTILGFIWRIEACKKFKMLFKQYKIDKLTNNILREESHECKFYESIDKMWHQTCTIMKHVTTFVDGMKLLQFENNTKLLEKLISKSTS
jgi:hypothetical protein